MMPRLSIPPSPTTPSIRYPFYGDGKILALCHSPDVWVKAFKPYKVEVDWVDVVNGVDVRVLERSSKRAYHGIILDPPGTHLACSGARWWKAKGRKGLRKSMSFVDACLRATVIYDWTWWMLMNPIGRLTRMLGEPVFAFDPCNYAGWANDPEDDAYTKRTHVWGKGFNIPEVRHVHAALGSAMHLVAPSPERTAIRSQTPVGFARAFAAANYKEVKVHDGKER